MTLKKISSHLSFGGEQARYRHYSSSLNCEMTFSVYLPPIAVQAISAGKDLRLPILYWLSGLTCNDENFVQKAGAQATAANLGLIIVMPDTSPRGESVPDDSNAAYDFGLGAGFYLNATESPWSKHYQMYHYVTEELPSLLESNFPVDRERQSISGHSMGGHGALTIALKNKHAYKSVSAFAPICAPMKCPWGQKAFTSYLGKDEIRWQDYDATYLASHFESNDGALPILIDQGNADEFLDTQLKPELFIRACESTGLSLKYNLRSGYDHSFFFIATFIDSHLRFHFEHLVK